MLAATTKIGGKIFVQVEVLQAIKSRIDNLPAKQKTMLEFKEAVAFLYPCIKNAVQKNYSKDEILQIIVKEGWEITQNSFRYLWSLFLSEDENPRKRRPYVKSIRKIKTEKNKSDIEINKNILADKDTTMNDTSSLSQVPPTSSKVNTDSSAYFVIQPDTEDL